MGSSTGGGAGDRSPAVRREQPRGLLPSSQVPVRASAPSGWTIRRTVPPAVGGAGTSRRASPATSGRPRGDRSGDGFLPSVFGRPHLMAAHPPGWRPVVQYRRRVRSWTRERSAGGAKADLRRTAVIAARADGATDSFPGRLMSVRRDLRGQPFDTDPPGSARPAGTGYRPNPACAVTTQVSARTARLTRRYL
ncbi:DUF5937 family protein [Streptomyces sp. NPDC059398]|uniref:DUF5937 family protein n=1 Tax=Streptomyces sp. NPDC059398 TaxID=3346820 RepID=UPI0036869764